MSDASQRNFGIAQRERSRRLAMAADDPFDMTSAQAANDTGWNTFFGALREKGEAANAAGLNFRADLSGLGRDGEGDMGFSLAGNPFEQRSRQQIGFNMALGDYADRSHAAEYENRMRGEAALAGVQGRIEAGQVDQDRQALDAAGQNADADGLTPAQRREALLRSVPEHMRPQVQAIFDKQDADAAGLKQAAAQTAQTIEGTKLAGEKQDLERDKFKATYGTGMDENGQPMASPLAKQIAEYRVPPPSPRSLQSPAGQALMAQIAALNPSFDATQFPTRQKARTEFTTGTQGQQVDAMNTAVQHLDLMAQAADALKNGTMVPGNELYNRVKSLMGGAEPSNYETIKHFVDGEVGSVVKKGAVTEGEMAAQSKRGGSGSSPEQIRGYIDSVIPLMASKIHSLNYRAANALGEKDPLVRSMLMPEVQTILQRRGFNAQGTAAEPAGAVPAAAAAQGGSVIMIAPNGAERAVSADQVTHYLALGAKVKGS